MSRKAITDAPGVPAGIGPYSQAVRCGDTVYLSGQIGLNPESMQLEDGIEAQVNRVFNSLQQVIEAAGARLEEVVKLNIYLTDLGHFGLVNQKMEACFSAPYPARATLQVAALPKGALVEVDAILMLDS